MGAEEGGAQPRKNKVEGDIAETGETLQPRTSDPKLYEGTLLTCILEYAVILLFGISMIVEYYHNVYQQEYFGSFNPVFLVIVLMASSGYGFARLVNLIGRTDRDISSQRVEDDY